MSREQSVIVIGSGISGLQAAIELADCGVHVYLVDRNITLGGNANKLYKVFPTDDCAFCVVSTTQKPGIRKCFYRAGISNHPRITLLPFSEVKAIEGEFGKFQVRITQQPRYVNDTCTRCGKCEEACPVDVLPQSWSELTHKAIFLPAKMCIPQTYVIDRSHCPSGCEECLKVCPFVGVVNLHEMPRELVLKAAAIVLATGYRELDPSPLYNLKYKHYENVITQLELGLMLDPNGPTKGKLLRPSDGKPVRSLIMIQCVGSRDESFKKYCSTICCSYACKHARIIKQERNADVNITIIYMDVRTFGMLEQYYRECRELGIDFLRGRVAEILRSKDDRLRILGVDTLLQSSFEFLVDLVVLTPALIPGNECSDLLKGVGVELDSDGFIYSKNGDKTLTSIDGIYACGTAIAPTDIPTSVTLAKSAVFNVLRRMREGGI